MSAGMNETRGIVEAYFNDNFTQTVIGFPSVPLAPAADTAYITPTVFILSRERITMGTKDRRIQGNIIVQCFAPSLNGSASDSAPYLGQSGALAIADAVASLLDQDAIQGVCLKDTDIQDVGDDGEFWQVNVTCPFWRDIA